jgi:hypothetical protein
MISQGQRLTAAKLAGLHPADREWMLRRLPADQARIVRHLLGRSDLKRLGVHALAVETPAASPPPPQAAANDHAALRQQLAPLSPAWAALSLAALSPEHLDRYLGMIDRSRAQKVTDAARRFTQGLPASLSAAIADWSARDDVSTERMP